MLHLVVAAVELGADPYRLGLERVLRLAGPSCRVALADPAEELPALRSFLARFVLDLPPPALSFRCRPDWWPDDKVLPDLDAALAAAFFMLARQLAPELDRAGTLVAVWSAPGRVTERVVPLLPGNERYAGRVAALRHYLRYATGGDFPILSREGKLGLGAVGPRVARLKRRLVAEGYLSQPAAQAGGDRFDKATQAAVRAYREAYGLKVNGMVNTPALEQMARGADEYCRGLWGSLHRTLAEGTERGDAYLLVNLPEFATAFVADGRTVGRYRSVIGFAYQSPGGRTPVLTSWVTHLDLNPVWTPTEWVRDKELAPKAGEDEQFYEKNGFVRRNHRLVQLPGPDNTLGQVRIAFPNEHNIYLHGSPDKEKFGHAVRALSHGCVRVDGIEELTGRILDWAGVTLDLPLDDVFARVVERRVVLPKELPVYIIYDRVRVVSGRVVAILPDPYQLDSRMAASVPASPTGKLVSLARSQGRIAQR
jgi:murein L,D-transpeptidase YcbB/YkuD